MIATEKDKIVAAQDIERGQQEAVMRAELETKLHIAAEQREEQLLNSERERRRAEEERKTAEETMLLKFEGERELLQREIKKLCAELADAQRVVLKHVDENGRLKEGKKLQEERWRQLSMNDESTEAPLSGRRNRRWGAEQASVQEATQTRRSTWGVEDAVRTRWADSASGRERQEDNYTCQQGGFRREGSALANVVAIMQSTLPEEDHEIEDQHRINHAERPGIYQMDRVYCKDHFHRSKPMLNDSVASSARELSANISATSSVRRNRGRW